MFNNNFLNMGINNNLMPNLFMLNNNANFMQNNIQGMNNNNFMPNFMGMNNDEEWMKGFQIAINEEENNDNEPKMQVTFKKTTGETTNLYLNMEQPLTKF